VEVDQRDSAGLVCYPPERLSGPWSNPRAYRSFSPRREASDNKGHALGREISVTLRSKLSGDHIALRSPSLLALPDCSLSTPTCDIHYRTVLTSHGLIPSSSFNSMPIRRASVAGVVREIEPLLSPGDSDYSMVWTGANA
jgi:hypothetical protein